MILADHSDSCCTEVYILKEEGYQVNEYAEKSGSLKVGKVYIKDGCSKCPKPC